MDNVNRVIWIEIRREGNVECEPGCVLCAMGFCVVISFRYKVFSKCVFFVVNMFYSNWGL